MLISPAGTPLTSGVSANAISSALGISSGRKSLNVGIFGSSNVGGTAYNDAALFTDQYDSFGNAQRLKHDATLTAFTTPVNNDNNVLTYNRINEQMYYGPIEAMITRLQEYTNRQVNVVSGFDSSQPVGYALNGGTNGWFVSRNGSDPFDTGRQYGQVISRLKELMDLTGEPIDVIYLPDAGKDSTYASGAVPANTVTQYKAGIQNLITDLGLDEAKVSFILPNLGPTPVNTGYPNWDNIRTAINNESDWGVTNLTVIDPVSIGLTLEEDVLWEYACTGLSGAWTIGETVSDGTNSETLTLFTNSATRLFMERKPGAGFSDNTTLTGATSGATITSANPANPITVHLNTRGLNAMGHAAANAANDHLTLSSAFYFHQVTSANLVIDFDLEDAKNYDLSGSDIVELRSRAQPFYATVEGDAPTYEATGFNGRPCMDFDGVDDMLAILKYTEDQLGVEDGYSLFALIENDDISDSGSSFNFVIAMGNYVDSTSRGKILVNQPRNDMDNIGTYSNGSGASAFEQVVGDATPYLFLETVEAAENGEVNVFLDGGDAVITYSGDTSDIDTTQSDYYLRLGGDNSSTRRFSGKMNRVLLFDGELSSADRAKVSSELLKRTA